jgi:hypothetical protein
MKRKLKLEWICPIVYLLIVLVAYLSECAPYWQNPNLPKGNLCGIFMVPLTLLPGGLILAIIGSMANGLGVVQDETYVPVLLLPLLLGSLMNAFVWFVLIRKFTGDKKK